MSAFFSSLAVVCLCSTSSVLSAQLSPATMDFLKLEDGQYFADRDSAFLDPYYGLKKLIYGNRRFADRRSIRPRQTEEDLRNTELGQKPFATITWLCRQPRAQRDHLRSGRR